MTRRSGPVVLLAAALIASVALVAFTPGSTWTVAAGALLFTLALLGADVWVSRLRQEPPLPSRSGLVLAVAFLAACAISLVNDPQVLADKDVVV